MTDSSVGIPTEPNVFTISVDFRATPSLWYITTTGNMLQRLDLEELASVPIDVREKAVLLALLEHAIKLVKDLG